MKVEPGDLPDLSPGGNVARRHFVPKSPPSSHRPRPHRILGRVLACTLVAAALVAAPPARRALAGSILPPGSPMVVDPNVDPPGYNSDNDVDCGVSAGWQLARDYNEPRTLDGQVVQGHIASDDFPLNHGTKDYNFFVYPDQASRYLLSEANFSVGEEIEHGRMEVEWEQAGDPNKYAPYAAGFPSWAWPTQGDRVHVVGSHILDCGHSPERAEIHAPRMVVTYRNSAQDNFAGASNRKGSWFEFPENNGVPSFATRADVFASSYGGESVEEEYDNENINLSALFPHDEGPVGDPQTWWQPINDRDYSFPIYAPTPKPAPDAQLVVHVDNHAVTGATGPDPVFTPLAGGNGFNVTIPFKGWPDPASHLMTVGKTIYVGWSTSPADALVSIPNVRHYRVTVNKIHIINALDDVTHCSSISMAAYVNEKGARLLSGDKTDSLGETYKTLCNGDDVTGNQIHNRVFDVSAVVGQPLRIQFRGIDYEPTENDELGTAEDIWIEDNTGDAGWANVGHTINGAAGGIMGDEDTDDECLANPLGCYSIDYRIDRVDPPASALNIGTPSATVGGQTWVKSSTPITQSATAGVNGTPSISTVHEFYRDGALAPGTTWCGAPCTFYIDNYDGADGLYNLYYWSHDNGADVTEQPHFTTLALDNTAPTTSASLTGAFTRGWYHSPVGISLPADDGSGIGVKTTTYSLDGAPSASYTSPFTVTAESASHVLNYHSDDLLGNTEGQQAAAFKIDTTLPTLQVTNASDGTFNYTEAELAAGVFTNGSNLSINYSAGDALSGLYQVRLDGTTTVSPTGTLSTAVPAGVSFHTLESEDVAGNIHTIAFAVVSVPPLAGGPDPRDAGFWKTAVDNGKYTSAQLGDFLTASDIFSQAFGPTLNRYADASLGNFNAYLTVTPGQIADLHVRKDLLIAWLNLVSGREPANQTITVKGGIAWSTVVQNTGGSNVTSALNLVREVERRLNESPSDALLTTIDSLLYKLNNAQLNS
jgi:hypothetical protein